MLLTVYGFDHLGRLGSETAAVVFLLAGILLLIAIALAVVGARKPKGAAATS
jgi:hypothetical protein